MNESRGKTYATSLRLRLLAYLSSSPLFVGFAIVIHSVLVIGESFFVFFLSIKVTRKRSSVSKCHFLVLHQV